MPQWHWPQARHCAIAGRSIGEPIQAKVLPIINRLKIASCIAECRTEQFRAGHNSVKAIGAALIWTDKLPCRSAVLDDPNLLELVLRIVELADEFWLVSQRNAIRDNDRLGLEPS